MLHYDALGRAFATIDALGHVTHITYDGLGRAVATTQNYAAGAPTSAITNVTTLTAYDALGQTTVVADALGAVTRTTYDALGHIATTTDAAGQVMQVSYDALDRLIRVTENAASGSCAAPPCNLVTQYQYDPAGNVNSWFVFVDGMSPPTA